MRKALSEEAIKAAVCPPGKNKDHVWDTVQPGLALRVYATGRKAYFAYYRVGSGRKAPQRWDLIGVAGKIALKDARSATRAKLGAVAKGSDPAGERRQQIRRDRARLAPALDSYEADLIRRNVVKRRDRMSLLRRELLGKLGNVDLASITRNDLVRLINAIEQDGHPGAAQDLRKNAAVFLGWAVDDGLIVASPLAVGASLFARRAGCPDDGDSVPGGAGAGSRVRVRLLRGAAPSAGSDRLAPPSLGHGPLDAAELAAIRAGRAIRLEKAAAPELALPSCRRSLAELFATQLEPR